MEAREDWQPPRKLWSASGTLECSWNCLRDDRAQGVGGRRGAEVKVTGEEEEWEGQTEQAAPSHLLCSAPIPPLQALVPSFWGSACPPNDSQMRASAPTSSPQFLFYVFLLPNM